MANVSQPQPSSHTRRMIESHPRPPSEVEVATECIAACLDCAQACVSCADACLSESDLSDLTRCIRLDNDCADLCETAARILSRYTAFEQEIALAAVRACEVACRMCADECERHEHEHCTVCAEACRVCEAACRRMLEISTQ